ncbi:MAG: Uma2 family endonuclease [Gemmataceae bacterium]
MAAPITTPMTAEEFFDWANRPENAGRRLELNAGEVEEMPSPGEAHALVCWLVIKLLTEYVVRRGRGHLLTNDCGLIVRRGPDTVRGPDVMLFLDDLTLQQARRGHTDRTPPLVVEVMSPSDTLPKIGRRVGQYLDRGAGLVWVVDPDLRAVYVHKPDEYMKVFDGDDELTGNGVLPDFSCRVADLFTLPGQPPATS